MILTPAKIAGVFVAAIEPAGDDRGFFARTFCLDELRAAGISTGPLRQTSISFNVERGTLRGMHWQTQPAGENKFVSVTAGTLFDVAIDLRPHSPTYRAWCGFELDAATHNAVFIPSGCAHGFLTLEERTIVAYGMDADYAPQYARGARWNDPAFGIEWPFEPAVIGDRDRNWPDFVP